MNVAHLIIANHILNETEIDKIWFVVSPQNPFKEESTLLNGYHRLHLVRLAIENDNRIKVSDFEFYLPKPSYTITALAYLADKYPKHEFGIIMGSDGFQNLHKWKNFDAIVKNYPLYVYKRQGFEIKDNLGAKLHIVEAPLLNISSTHIRKLILKGKSVRYLLPEKVLNEIEKGGYFKN
ncbi:MAG: nicotinate (nicotinamide) nucleotide adenylyltransferase [Chitinophagaceae bacterium]